MPCATGFHTFGVKKTAEAQLLLGCEIEVESTYYRDSEEGLDEIYSDSFFEIGSDCSLNNGAEIRTSPSTFWWLKENEDRLSPLWRLPREGYRSYQTTTCGFHIHLNNEALGPLTLYKLALFVQSNPDFAKTISCRRKYSFDTWSRISPGKDKDLKRNLLRPDYNYSKQEYSKINRKTVKKKHLGRTLGWLSKYEVTTEIRLFRGTLSSRGFWRNIEFCHSLVHFCKENPIEHVNDKYRYIDYVSKIPYYSTIFSFIESRETN